MRRPVTIAILLCTALLFNFQDRAQYCAAEPPPKVDLAQAGTDQIRELATSQDKQVRDRIIARAKKIAELLKEDKEDKVELVKLSKILEALGEKPSPIPAPIPGDSEVSKPKPGPAGKDGLSAYQVAVKNGFKGTEKEWLASLVGPAGPQGPPGKDAPTPPPIPVDAFTKAVQEAYADASTDKAAVPLVATVWKSLLPYVDSDATTGDLYSRYKAGFEAAGLAGKASKLMDVINKPLNDLMGAVSQPLTADMRTAVKSHINRTLTVLGGLK